jgi:hypothetical protein
VTGRRRRRRKKLLDDLKEREGYSHLKEEALDRTMWRARFGRGFELVVRQTAAAAADDDMEVMSNYCKNNSKYVTALYFLNVGFLV